MECMGVKRHPIKFLPKRYHDVHSAFSNHERAKVILDFEERIGWRRGVKRMAEWAREMGPQEWHNYDQIEIPNEKTPKNWV